MTTAGKSRLKEQAIAALLTGADIAECAAQVWISERTLLRWMQEPEFKKRWSEADKALSQAKAARLRATNDSLLRKGPGAVETLDTVHKDTKAPAGARVMAASEMLKQGRAGYQQEELERRVAELERNFAREGQ